MVRPTAWCDEQLMDAVCDVAVQHGVPVHGMAGTAHGADREAPRRGLRLRVLRESGLPHRRLADHPARPVGDTAGGRRRVGPPGPDGGRCRDRHRRAGPRPGEGICVYSDTPHAVDVAIVGAPGTRLENQWIRLKRKGPLMAENPVRSPLPGVFYRSPSPTAPPFVEVGSSVTADETIGMIEIMKQFAEVKAGADGNLTAFAVDDQATVGPGDPIATIDAG